MKINTEVSDQYGMIGTISAIYDSWEDLKNKCEFITLDEPDMDNIERLIKGDPRDKWLEMQTIPFTSEELQEKWYSVTTLNGGSIWSCESKLKVYGN